MKLEITIYGSGCPRCRETARVIESYMQEKGIEATVKKVTDIAAIMRAGILSTPAVAVNGIVLIEGSVPTKEKLDACFKL